MTPSDAYDTGSLLYTYSIYFCFDSESCLGTEFMTDTTNYVINGWLWCGQAESDIDATTTSFDYDDCYDYAYYSSSTYGFSDTVWWSLRD
jgi:hypothetical protein